MTGGKRIFGALTIAIALFFFWPVVIGGWQKVAALKMAVAEREQLLADRTKILADTAAAYSEYQQKLSETDGQKFVALVPVKKDLAEVVSALDAIAAESGVQLGDVTASEGKAKESEQFKTLSLTMALQGTYDAMRSFLTLLESYVRVLNVNTIEAGVDSANSSQLQFKISADAYFIK